MAKCVLIVTHKAVKSRHLDLSEAHCILGDQTHNQPDSNQ